MKKIKELKKWGIYELNAKEASEEGFAFAVIHPSNMHNGPIEPRDTDIELETLQQAEDWVNNYDKK